MIMTSTPSPKHMAQQAKIAADVAAFIKAGGIIQRFEIWESADCPQGSRLSNKAKNYARVRAQMEEKKAKK